jgi:folate-binding protein YgfZ
MTLADLHRTYGAVVAPDGIPLHYASLLDEYRAGLETAVLLDRSHEGRVVLSGADRFALINRMSTNKMVDMAAGEGRVTLFTNATARILERITAYNRADDLLVVTEPGRGQAFTDFIRRNIFFNDKVQPANITAETAGFALHGPRADAIMDALVPGLAALPALHSQTLTIGAATLFAARRKSISGAHWLLVPTLADAEAVYKAVLETGKNFGLLPAGSLTYNTLRIRAGYPAGREVSQDYLPLEVGLWDDVSFSKGCYTGQEIIARMEARERIARTIVSVTPSADIEAPAPVYLQNNTVGTLTSSVTAPDGSRFALAVVKIAAARPGTALTLGEQGIAAEVTGMPAVQPPYLNLTDPESEPA